MRSYPYRARHRPQTDEQFKQLLVKNAAFVGYETQRRLIQKSDLKLEEKEFVYVFDTNIVMAFCAPFNVGPLNESDGQGGLGQIMPLSVESNLSSNEFVKVRNTEKRNATDVVRLLADLAFSSSATTKQSTFSAIFQLGAHFTETIDIYKVVRRKLLELGEKPDQVDSRINRDIELSLALMRAKHLGWYDAPDLSLEEIATNIISKITELGKVNKRPLVQEWDNYIRLHKKFGGLFDINSISVSHDKESNDVSVEARKKLRDIVLNCRNLWKSENPDFKKEYEYFYRTLERTRSRQSDPANISVDANALTELYLINREIHKNNLPFKVVLVTADKNLTEALSKTKKRYRVNERFRQNKTIAEQRDDFGFDCIQHLWSFVSEFGAQKVNFGEDRASQLFSGLLASIIPDQASSESRLENYLKLHQNPVGENLGQDVIDIAEVEWSHFCTLASQNVAVQEIGEDKLGHQLELREQIISRVKEHYKIGSWGYLRDQVSELAFRALDRANVAFSDVGSHELLRLRLNSARNPPDLLFNNLPKSQLLIRRLASPYRGYYNAISFEHDYNQIKMDCYNSRISTDDRQEIYLNYLVLAALFASADRWFAAEQHARNALAIVKRSNWPVELIPVKENTDVVISGREAWYLLSMARRLRAETAKDFEKSESYLMSSRVAFEQEEKNKSTREIFDLRYQNEELAVALGHYYYNRYMCEKANLINKEYYPLKVIKVYKIANEMLKMVQRHKTKGIYNEVRDSTRVMISTNLLQCAVIQKFRETSAQIETLVLELSSDAIKDSISEIYELTNIKDLLLSRGLKQSNIKSAGEPVTICTELMLRYASAGSLLIENNRSFFSPRSKRDIEKLFSQDSSTPYDQSRFERLKVFISEVLLPK